MTSKEDDLRTYLQGWAAGLEFGYQNPRAAAQIVIEQFPGLARRSVRRSATKSMLQQINVFRGGMDKRGGGATTSGELAGVLRQEPQDRPDHSGMKVEDVCKND